MVLLAIRMVLLAIGMSIRDHDEAHDNECVQFISIQRPYGFHVQACDMLALKTIGLTIN